MQPVIPCNFAHFPAAQRSQVDASVAPLMLPALPISHATQPPSFPFSTALVLLNESTYLPFSQLVHSEVGRSSWSNFPGTQSLH